MPWTLEKQQKMKWLIDDAAMHTMLLVCDAAMWQDLRPVCLNLPCQCHLLTSTNTTFLDVILLISHIKGQGLETASFH